MDTREEISSLLNVVEQGAHVLRGIWDVHETIDLAQIVHLRDALDEIVFRRTAQLRNEPGQPGGR